MNEVFAIKKEREVDFNYEIRVAVMEIYNETVIDLLSSDKKKLELMMTGAEKVPNVTTVQVNSSDEVIKALKSGYKNRAVGSNNINEHSSRSHW